MSWKMFGQIVLLIIITVVILLSMKCLKYKMCGMQYKKMVCTTQSGQNFSQR